MEFRKTEIEGLIEIFPRLFKDERGYFFESFHKELFEKNGVPCNFPQDNQSFSNAGVLRGLHFQNKPFAQGKLVRVILGKALDVAVDLRPNSPTFGKHKMFVLDADLHNMVYIPEGFAHGFLSLEDCIFTYKCTNVYHKASESGIIWNDPTLNINWGVECPNVSEKDLALSTFEQLFGRLKA